MTTRLKSEALRYGDYLATEQLGSGAGGTVFRGEHQGTGSRVALKVLTPGSPGDLEHFHRETSVLLQLQHPGVVRVVEHGLSGPTAWYAMELVDGSTLGALWSRITAKERLRVSLPILRDLCLALAFVHGEGLVHRDLKPSNIMLRAGNQPILVDFGLAGRFGGRSGREGLEVGGELVGTYSYMAPEQWRGEFVDARADLYAVGCLLYEAATGRPPFDRPGWDLMNQHLTKTPLPPRGLSPEISAELEALILALLAKDVRDRPGYALDVAQLLSTELGLELPSVEVSPRPYLYRPTLAGRSQALETLELRLDRAASAARGSVTLVAGESGVGKTRLAMEATRRASGYGLSVVLGGCEGARDELGRTPPLDPLRPLLRAVAELLRADEDRARFLAHHTSVLAAFEPALVHTGTHGQTNLPSLGAQANRDRVLLALGEVLRSLVAAAPTLLVVDDLQWADDLTLAFLDSLAVDPLVDTPLVVLGTYRVAEATQALEKLRESQNVHALLLPQVGPEAIATIVSDMLAMPSVSPSLLERIEADSEGNPFFICEYLRAAVEQGFLERGVGEGWRVAVPITAGRSGFEQLPLPRTIQELVRGRFQHLSEDATKLLNAAAVMGRELEVQRLNRVLEDEAHHAYAELVQRHVLEVAPGGNYRFPHDKLREVAYARVTPANRRHLHALVAASLERDLAGAEQRPDLYALLAHHWTSARRPAKAVEFNGRAGEHALRSGAHADARVTLSLALELADSLSEPLPPERLARWSQMLATAEFARGDLEASVSRSSAALTHVGYRAPTGRWRAIFTLSWQLARQLLRRTTSYLWTPRSRGDESTLQAAIAAGQLATSFYYSAQPLPSLAAILLSLNLAEDTGEDARVAAASAQLGYVAGAAKLHRVARTLFERAREASDHSGYRSTLAFSLYMEAMYWLGLGEWERCLELSRQSQETFVELGDLQEAEVAQTIGAHALHYSGDDVSALAEYRAIRESSRERSNPQHIAWGLFLGARSHLSLGELETARDQLEAAYPALLPLPDSVSVTMCEGSLARVHLSSGKLEAAREIATRLADRLRSGRRPTVAQCLDAYSGLAETRLTLLELDPSSSRHARRDAEFACRELKRFARLFAIAKPASLRAEAWRLRLAGRGRRALKAVTRSLAAAERLRMPHEAQASTQELERIRDTFEIGT